MGSMPVGCISLSPFSHKRLICLRKGGDASSNKNSTGFCRRKISHEISRGYYAKGTDVYIMHVVLEGEVPHTPISECRCSAEKNPTPSFSDLE